MQDHGLRALEHYLLHRDCPEILESGLIDKVLSYHELRDKRKVEHEKAPETSEVFRERAILSEIGLGIDSADPSKSIEEREMEMEKNAREHNLVVGRLASIERNRRAAYLEVLRKRRDDRLKTVPTPEEQSR